jgi:type I restriction enzyme S subunit
MLFYSETNFKETPIGKIPNDWEIVPIKEACEFIKGTEPGSKSYNTKGEGYKFIRVSDVSKQILQPVFTKEKKDKLIFCNKEDVLLTLDGVPGVVNMGFDGAISSGIRIVKPKNSNLHNKFLFYILQHRIVQKVIKNHTTGTTIKHAGKAINFIKIPLPPLQEQQKIAEILSNLDEAIQKTDEIIAKTERLKKGLMEELLIGRIRVEEKDGKIIFRKETEFKDTEIGRIPKDWNITSAEKLCKKVTDGTHDTPKPAKEGFYLITSKHIKEGKIDFSEAYFISEKDFIEINNRSRVNVGDVLFSMIGTVGATAIITKDTPSFAIKNVGLFKTNGDFVLANWLYYYFQSSIAKRYINDNLKGTTQKYLPLYALRKFSIILPLPAEKQKIAEILSTIDKKLEIERKRKEKLERIKKGLMDLLLTGKIRVKVEEVKI